MTLRVKHNKNNYFRTYKSPLFYLAGRDVAVLILDKPFHFDDYVRPACLPQSDWTASSFYKGGKMIASGMGRIDNDHRTTELKLARMHMFTKDECRKDPWGKNYFKGERFIIYLTLQFLFKMV